MDKINDLKLLSKLDYIIKYGVSEQEYNNLILEHCMYDYELKQKGFIKGYEEDRKANGGGFRVMELHLNKSLDLGNNFTNDHFVNALVNAYYDTDLIRDLGDLYTTDDLLITFNGKFGKLSVRWAVNDLFDYLSFQL